MPVRGYIAFSLAAWLTLNVGLADSLDVEYKRILRTVAKDSAYSRLYYMDLSGEDLNVKAVRHRNLERRFTDGNSPFLGAETPPQRTYRFIYIPVQFNFLDMAVPLVPLVIEEMVRTRERAPQGSIGATITTKPIFDLRDFMAMKNDFPAEFSALVHDLNHHHIEGKGYPLGSKIRRRPDEENSFVLDGNWNYFRHLRLIGGYVGNPHGSEAYSIDATWSAIKLSLDFASEAQWLGVQSFGIELGFGDRVLSLLAYQSPYLAWGGRLLVFFGGEKASIDTSFFFDIRILGRSPINTSLLIDRWKLNRASPIASLESSMLNVTSGVAIELRTGRPFSERLPHLTLYYSGGPTRFDDPYVKRKVENRDIAYFSTIQWETYLSFYWNLERERYNTMNLDLGAGSYNVFRAELDSVGRARSYSNALSLTQVKPLVALSYLHDSRAARFGANVRLFDNRLTLHPWLKIFRNDPHELRMEFLWLTRVFGRSPLPWEVEQGSMLQLRYRFGL